jgi:hypothetical protein
VVSSVRVGDALGLDAAWRMSLQPAADDLLTCLLTVARSLYTMELASPRPSRGLRRE